MVQLTAGLVLICLEALSHHFNVVVTSTTRPPSLQHTFDACLYSVVSYMCSKDHSVNYLGWALQVQYELHLGLVIHDTLPSCDIWILSRTIEITFLQFTL